MILFWKLQYLLYRLSSELEDQDTVERGQRRVGILRYVISEKIPPSRKKPLVNKEQEETQGKYKKY